MNQTPIPKNPALGFGMQDMGDAVMRIVADVCERFGVVTYLEIGVGHGGTLCVVADQLSKCARQWRAIGIDLPNGYSLDVKRVEDAIRSREINFIQPSVKAQAYWDEVTLYLADSQKFLRKWSEPTHLALIDGCHGKPCAMNDFINIEKSIVQGGIVMFHDFGQDQVGQAQPHCPTGLDVRGACRDLGLLDESRPGWNFLQTIIGDKAAGSGDMGIFQKSEDRLS